MASPGAVVAPLARNNNLRYAAMLGEENRFSALDRLRDLWEDLSRWAAQAFWIAVLAGAVAVAKGPTWLYASRVITASCVSAWILLQMVRLYWHDCLAWLLSKTGSSCSPSPSAFLAI